MVGRPEPAPGRCASADALGLQGGIENEEKHKNVGFFFDLFEKLLSNGMLQSSRMLGGGILIRGIDPPGLGRHGPPKTIKNPCQNPGSEGVPGHRPFTLIHAVGCIVG